MTVIRAQVSDNLLEQLRTDRTATESIDRAGGKSGVGGAGCGLDGAKVSTTPIAARQLGAFSGCVSEGAK